MISHNFIRLLATAIAAARLSNAAAITHYITDLTVVDYTPPPLYVTITAAPHVQTVVSTVTKKTEIHVAASTPTVTVTGSYVTTIKTITETPVTQYSAYPTTAGYASIDINLIASGKSIAVSEDAFPEDDVTIVSVESTAYVLETSCTTPTPTSPGPLVLATSLNATISQSSGIESSSAATSRSAVLTSSAATSRSAVLTSSAATSRSAVLTSSAATSKSAVLTSSAATSRSAVLTSSAAATTTSVGAALTSAISPSKSVSPKSSSAPAAPTAPKPPTVPVPGSYYADGGIMDAISTDQPDGVFTRQNLAFTLPGGVNNNNAPIHTNKFYSNFILGQQHQPAYCQPYSLWWSNDKDYYGMSVSYVDASQRVFGPDPAANPAQYYINPVGLISVSFAATEFSSTNMKLSTSNFDTFSVTATLGAQGTSGTIEFPLALGMGLVTAKYNGLTPRLFSQFGFKNIEKGTGIKTTSSDIDKYEATLFDGKTWIIYVSKAPGDDFSLNVDNNYQITGSKSVNNVVIQAGVLPSGDSSKLDAAAGLYATGVSLDASTSNDVATYSLSYSTSGESTGGNLILYALPHHVSSFASDMSSASTGYNLQSPTKGMMTGYLTNKFSMTETLHTSMQFLPWSPSPSFSGVSYSSDALKNIAKALNSEINQDISGMTNVDSTYTAGKIIDKFAYMLLVAKEVLDDDVSAQSLLNSMKNAIAKWTANAQPLPFMYDTLFKGITSTGAQNGGDPMADYGAPYYNDHHFHYGYWIHACAVVGYVDAQYGGNWAQTNKNWVNSLIRDVANPSKSDSYFPVFRMFDFYHGHSWAAGLFESADGKNEESTSEDVNFAYAMKVWGKVIGDKRMEARGDLMLSIMSRAINDYMLMQSNNQIQPSKINGNRVTGITFENKCDHATFFGMNEEYIQGIQMIPIIPASGLTRPAQFVQQEWNEKLAPLANSLNSGWLGIIRSNQALFDPVSSYNFFAQSGFSTNWLDNGASLTWYLALSAGLGGAS